MARQERRHEAGPDISAPLSGKGTTHSIVCPAKLTPCARTAGAATVAACSNAAQAGAALGVLPPSAARDALLRLCFDVLNRKA
jgi:hypothetical protein